MAAVSPVSVSNMALARLGGAAIATMNEGSTESILCSTFFEPSRDATLRAHDWGFARRRRVLGEVSVAAVCLGGWAHAYAPPSDCLAVRRLEAPPKKPQKQHPVFERAMTFERGLDEHGKAIILTNAPTATLVYTARLVDLDLCDSLFIEALSWKLAAEIAVSLTQERGLFALASRHYQAVLLQAQTAEAREEHARQDDIPAAWITARGG